MEPYRRAPRTKTPDSWVKIFRSSYEGHQIVRLHDISKVGLAFESLTPRPYQVGERIQIIECATHDVRGRWSLVRHISPMKNDEGEEFNIVGVEFE